MTMDQVLCEAPHRGTLCRQVLLKVGDDFTGTIQIKCPSCRTMHTRIFTSGAWRVA